MHMLWAMHLLDFQLQLLVSRMAIPPSILVQHAGRAQHARFIDANGFKPSNNYIPLTLT